MRNRRFEILAVMGMIAISFPSCTGILGGLYDQQKQSETGFISVSGLTGTIALDVEDYDEWHYIDFSERQIERRDIEYPVGEPVEGENYEIPENWDIAIHRHDVKTNGGAIMKTASTSFNDFVGHPVLPEGEFIPDVPAAGPDDDLQSEDVKGKVTADMSGMMEGNFGYVASDLNLEIEDWLIMYGGMPPSFKFSPNVYLVKLQDDTYMGLKIDDYVSKVLEVEENGEKKKARRKVLIFSYFYPIEFSK